MVELGQIAAGLPLAASFAVAATVGGLRAGRRRTALNEALHELRRPLQALALSSSPGAEGGSLELAAEALRRLEREINGEVEERAREAVAVGPLLEAAARRWRPRAELGGGSVRVRRGGEAVVWADLEALARALDNLVVNAIEHGGGDVLIEASPGGGRVRLAVIDCGAGAGTPRRHGRGRDFARLRRRRGPRGHGLRIVRRIVAEHGGRFRLGRRGAATEAVVELPLRGPA